MFLPAGHSGSTFVLPSIEIKNGVMSTGSFFMPASELKTIKISVKMIKIKPHYIGMLHQQFGFLGSE